MDVQEAVVQALRAVIENGYFIHEGKADPTEDWAVPLPVYIDAMLALSELDRVRAEQSDPPLVWVFNAERARFPGGIFSSLEKAEAWISRHGLTGLLTGYPLDEGAYDWATRRGFFSPKRDDQRTAEFIAGFTSGRHHYHYEAGRRP